MKKQKQLLLICLLFLGLVLSKTSVAQIAPPTTLTALPNNNSFQSGITLNKSEHWFKFTTDSIHVSVKLKLEEQGTLNGLSKVELFKDAGGGLIQIVFSDTLRTDSTMWVSATFLNPTTDIYIRVTSVTQTCSTCSGNTYPKISMDVMALQAACNTYIQPPCQYVKDTSFEYATLPCASIPNPNNGACVNDPYVGFANCFWNMPLANSFVSCGGLGSLASLGTSDYYCTGGHTGSGCAGIFLYTQTNPTPTTYAERNYREYITETLFTPLTSGKTYSVSIWVKRNAAKSFATSNIEVALSNGIYTQNSFNAIVSPAGQVIPMASSVITSTTWTKLTSVFVASGNYSQMTIGNFAGVGSSNVTNINPSITLTQDRAAYYYIDDVSIIETFTTSVTNPVCLGLSSATINVIPSNAGTSYTWTSSPSTPTLVTVSGSSVVVSPTVTTNYTVSTTNALGCIMSNTVDVLTTPITFTASSYTFCPGSSPSTTITATGLTTYSWVPNPTITGSLNSPTITVSPTTTTTYTVFGNLTGCSNTYSSTVTITSISPTISISSSSVICIGTTVTVTTNSTATFSYADFDAPNGILGTSINPYTSVYTYTAAGTYSILAQSNDNINGCGTDYLTFPINVVPALNPTLTISPSQTICAGQTKTLTVSGANTYTWSTTATTNSIVVSPTVTTTYTVTGTGACGTGTASVKITVISPPSLTVTATPTVICSGKTTTLTASGASSYTWSPSGLTGTTVAVTPTASTIYTVTGSNGFCTNTKTISITVNPLPTITASTSGSICSGASATLTAGGGITYTWSTGSTTNPTTVSPSVTTTYTVTGSNGTCLNTKTVTVNVTATPTINIAGTPTIVCAGSSSTLSASGATSYTWNTGATTTSIVVTPTASSTTYTVTGKSGSCSSIKTITITSINQPTVTAIASSSAICAGLSTTLTAGGATSYTWNPGNTTTNPAIVSPTATTIYTVTGANVACSRTQTVSVTVNPAPSLTLSPLSTGICLGQSITVSASGASTYSWNTGVTTASIVLSPTVNTNYTVTGTGSNGCKSTAVYNLNVKPLPGISVSASANPICAGNTTTLTMSAGGTINSWSNGTFGNTNIVSPSVTTTYTAYTTNFTTGCSNSAVITVTVNPFTSLTVNPSTICIGQTATLTANGATSYTWNTGANTSSITVSPTVTTNYTVSGASGACPSASASLVLTVNSNPTITATANPTTMCIGNPATLTATGATSYSWSSGATTAVTTVTPGAISVYTVTGTTNGCTATNTVAIALTAQYCCQSAISTVGTSTTSSINYSNNSNGGGAVVDAQGTITFTANSTMSNYIIRMAPQTLIVINPGITVTFSNCTLYSCTQLWNGINLLTNTTTSISANVSVINSTIEDMYNGITLNYGGVNAVSGGSITISGSKLNKNYASVLMYYANGYSIPSITYPLSIKGSTISSVYSSTSPQSTLKQSTAYTYAYPTSANTPYVNFPRSYYGVYVAILGNKSPVVIGDSTGTFSKNRFDNLDFGVISGDVNLYLHNNHFIYINGSIKNISSITSAPSEIGTAVTSTNSDNRLYILRVGSNDVLSTAGNPYPKGNVFEDCYRGIYSSKNLRLWVKGNEFKSNSTSWPTVFPTGNLYDYNIAQYAISQYELGEMSNMSFNYITNQNYGIYNSYSIDNSVISQAKVKIENNFIDAPSSSGFCKQAIQIEQPASTNNLLTGMLTVKNNTIQNVYGGIKALNVKGGSLQINNNPLISLSANKTTGLIGNIVAINNYARTAILLQSCQDAIIANNPNITSVGTINPSMTYYTAVKGIWLDGSGGTNAQVNCNIISNMGRAMQFSSTSLNKVSKNVMNGTGDYQGFVLSNNGQIGPQGTSAVITNDNEWNGFTGGAAKYAQTYTENTSNANTNSILFVKPGSPYQPTQHYSNGSFPYVTSPVDGIRVQSAGISGESCLVLRMIGGDNSNTGNGSNAMRMASDDTDSTNADVFEVLASDTTFYEVYQNETQYRNKQLVYDLINTQSIDTTNTLSDFYEANQNTNYQTIININNAFVNADYQTAQNINNSLTANNTIEEYQKRVNELLLKYINYQSQTADSIPNPFKFTFKAPVFDGLELADLSTIANSCFDKFGSVITQARVLINNASNTVVEFNDNCNPELNKRKANKQNTLSVNRIVANILPNPNNGNFILQYDLLQYSNADLVIFDVTGKELFKTNLLNTANQLDMNASKFENGIYYYTIRTNKEVLVTNKFVIIK